MIEHTYRHITPSIHSSALVVRINEPHLRDASICYALRDEIVQAIDAVQPDKLVLDLGAVRFIGSIGLLAFLGARRQLPGRKILLCGMDHNIRELFRVCALTSADPSAVAPFAEATSVEAAVA